MYNPFRHIHLQCRLADRQLDKATKLAHQHHRGHEAKPEHSLGSLILQRSANMTALLERALRGLDCAVMKAGHSDVAAIPRHLYLVCGRSPNATAGQEHVSVQPHLKTQRTCLRTTVLCRS